MVNAYLEKTESYLRDHLLPFWTRRAPEPTFGGFQTNYDRDGKRTAISEKTLLCQARCLFTFAHAARSGWARPGDGFFNAGHAFLDKAFRDREYGGYAWIADEQGQWKDDRKTVYGHAFLIYAYSELGMVLPDSSYRHQAETLFKLLLEKAADLRYGGFLEHFTRDWTPDAVRPDGILHKSLDVHMHLMEAFTTLTEVTGDHRHAQALTQITDLIFERMIHPRNGTGIAIFEPDWTPLENLQLQTLWGSDRFNPEGKPPEITSYGHNIELAWLYLHSLDILGRPKKEGLHRVEPIFRHTLEHGVDHVHGGLFTEGHRIHGPTERNKEFWQQAEALVGFLEAFELTQDEAYWDAFATIHDFVFQHVINWDQGEWFPLVAEDGTVLWDYMGHNWKTCYHTVRAMCEVVNRLRKMA